MTRPEQLPILSDAELAEYASIPTSPVMNVTVGSRNVVAVITDLQRHRAAAKAVEALHAPDPERMTRNWDSLSQELGPACSHCIDCSSCGVESVFHPCLTIRTLRGEA